MSAEATRSDLPQGGEAQCPLCWRLFGSDSGCERHKPYTRPVSEGCKDPAAIGLERRDRRGLVVWVRQYGPGREIRVAQELVAS